MGFLDALLPLARAVAGAAGRERRGGRIRIPGLRSDVEVLSSAGAIPHLYAADEEDLWFAQGYLAARDRLWQMDFLRRAALGRLAEIFGERRVPWRDLSIFLRGRTTVDVDHFVRLAGLERGARASWAEAQPSLLRVLEHYAQGVNARIAEGPLPHEFRLLRYRPDPWTPLHSFAVQKLLAFELGTSWRALLVVEALRAAVPVRERLAALLPIVPADPPPLVPEAARLAALAAGEASTAALGGPHAGSNAWAVSGSRSASRSPLLCNDPHLLLTAPGPFHLVHLSGGRYDVAGASLPGLPGVIVGHNRQIAWGITLAFAQDGDLFAERVDSKGRYQVGDRWEPLGILREEIRVRGRKDPVVREVRSTRHGPLLTDLVDPLHEMEQGLALRWTGQDASAEIAATLALDLAEDWPSFRDALRGHGAPALHFTYADRNGHVGFQMAGRVPLRRGGGRLAILDGDADGWCGAVPFDELPCLYDPPGGVMASANQCVVGPDYPHFLSELYEPPYRYERIRSRLEADRPYTPDEMKALQLDLYSGWAARLVERLLEPLADTESSKLLTPSAKDALARVLAWDRVARPESDGAAVFYVFHDRLVRELLGSVIGKDALHAWLELFNASILPVENLLLDSGGAWLSEGERRRACASALDEAAALLEKRLGRDPGSWRWGALHPLRLRHRLDELGPLRGLVSPGPFETGGDGMTVNSGHYVHATPWSHRVGAVYRQIFDLADWDRGLVISCSGQSGNPLSRHYRDHLDLWLEGEYLPLPFTRAAVERAATEHGRTLLVPAPEEKR